MRGMVAQRDKVDLGRARDAPGPIGRLVQRLRGRPVRFDLSPYLPRLVRIHVLGEEVRPISDAELLARAAALADDGESRGDERLCQVFALAREAAGRALGMWAFEVQIVGAMVLPEGRLLDEDGHVRAPPELRGPSSTWTCLVDDDPFRQALSLHVAASLTLGIGAALYAPLYIPVALYRRFRRR